MAESNARFQQNPTKAQHARPRLYVTALLAALQDDLGRLNDLVLARAHGLTRPDQPQTLAHAQTLWTRLRASPTFWTKP